MSLVKGISSIVGLGLTATAIGVGVHLSSSSNDSTVRGKLSSKKDRFLNFDYSRDESYRESLDEHSGPFAAWLAVASKYSSENDASKKFPDLSFTYDTSTRGNNAKNQESIKELKKRCEKLLISEGSEKNISLFESWCTRPEGS